MEENSVLRKSFIWMFIGLLVTFGTGFLVSNYENMLENIFSGGYWIYVVVELILVIVLSARIMKMNPMTAKICFIIYSFVSGLTFSSIFVFYEMTSIMFMFLITALMFGSLALLGYTTKVDLSKIGTYFLVGLFGVIILSIVNIFVGSSPLEMGLSIVCLILFLGVTAYDVQKLKRLENSNLPKENLAIYGALDLYLDFINIFIHLLELFGKSDK